MIGFLVCGRIGPATVPIVQNPGCVSRLGVSYLPSRLTPSLYPAENLALVLECGIVWLANVVFIPRFRKLVHFAGTIKGIGL